MKKLVALFLTLFFSTLSCFAALASPPGEMKEEYKIFQKELIELFANQDWTSLEKTANECRDKKICFSDGFPKLGVFYESLDPKNFLKVEQADAVWEKWYSQIDEWEKAFPQTITTPGIRINYWTSYAWKARGTSYSDKVDQNQWPVFRERLSAAEGIFRRKLRVRKDGIFPCPGFYCAALNLALGQGWETEITKEEILRPIIALDPRYSPAYTNATQQHQPKWGGDEGDDYRYYASLPALIGGDAGKEMMVRALLYCHRYALNTYRRDLMDWEAIKDGMIVALRNAPGSIENLSNFVGFASLYGEEQQMEILQRAKVAVPELVADFEKQNLYGYAWKLHEEKPECSLKFVRLSRPDGYTNRDKFDRISLSSENKVLAVSTLFRGARVVALDSDATIHANGGGDVINIISEFSPSGKYYLVASRPKRSKNATLTHFRLYATTPEGMKLLREAELECGRIEGIAFTPDSKHLIFVNRKYRVQSGRNLCELFHWDLETEKTVPEKFFTGAPQVSYLSIAIESEENALYCGGHGFFRFDLADLKKPPVNLCSDPVLCESLFTSFAFIQGGDFCVISTLLDYGKGEIVIMDRSSRQVITRCPIENVDLKEIHLVATKSSDGKKDIIVTSGFSGSITTWVFEKLEGKPPELILESAIPGVGEPTLSLISGRTDDGRNLVIQGTQNGYIGLYEAK